MKMKTTRLAAQSAKALAGHAYQDVVHELTLKLKSGFRAGKLREFRSGDGDLDGGVPFFAVEDAVDKRFIRGDLERAALVLMASPSTVAAARHVDGGGRWEHAAVAGLACTALALDVVACAEARGWVSKPKATRRAA